MVTSDGTSIGAFFCGVRYYYLTLNQINILFIFYKKYKYSLVGWEHLTTRKVGQKAWNLYEASNSRAFSIADAPGFFPLNISAITPIRSSCLSLRMPVVVFPRSSFL
ncbi:hypothetical protein QF042_001609 [Pedobacter sp. W3I1]|nr:hypothetical protein [Pedobacter sp. W3I1]